MSRIHMRINAHLCAFAYIFIYLRQMYRARLYSTGPLHIYIRICIVVVYLKRLTMAIAMVVMIPEIDWENHSVRNEERSRRGRRDVGERVTGNEIVGALQTKKRDGKQARYADGGSREIETRRRSGREVESGESSGTSSCRSRGGWLLS